MKKLAALIFLLVSIYGISFADGCGGWGQPACGGGGTTFNGGTVTTGITAPSLSATYGITAASATIPLLQGSVGISTPATSGYSFTVNGSYDIKVTTYTMRSHTPTNSSNLNTVGHLYRARDRILVTAYGDDYHANLATYKIGPSTISLLGSVTVNGTNDQGQGNFNPAEIAWVTDNLIMVGLGYTIRTTTHTVHLVSISSVAAPTNVEFLDSTDLYKHLPFKTAPGQDSIGWRSLPHSVDTQGNYIAMGFGAWGGPVVSSDVVRIFDKSDPLRWRYVAGEEITQIPNGEYVNGVYFHGNLLIITCEASAGSDIFFFDISQLGSGGGIKFIRQVNNTVCGEIRGVDFDENVAYFSDWDNATIALDISDPAASIVMLSSAPLQSGSFYCKRVAPYVLFGNETTLGVTGDTSINFEVMYWPDPTVTPVSVFKLFGRTKAIPDVIVDGSHVLLQETGAAGLIYDITLPKAVIPAAEIGSAKVSILKVTGDTNLQGSLKVDNAAEVGYGGLMSYGPGSFVGGVAVSTGPGGYVCHDIGPVTTLPTAGYHECDHLWLTTDHRIYKATATVTGAGCWIPVGSNLATATVSTATVTNQLNIGNVTAAPLPNSILTVSGSTPTFFEGLDVQNMSNGVYASGDITVTGDLGGNTSYYVNLGFNSSKYSDGTFTITGATSAYLYTNGGDLAVGAGTANNLKLFAGGTLAANEAVRVTPTSTTVLGAGGLKVNYGVIAGSATIPTFLNPTTFTSSMTITSAGGLGLTYGIYATTGVFTSSVTVGTAATDLFTVKGSTIVVRTGYGVSFSTDTTSVPLMQVDINRVNYGCSSTAIRNTITPLRAGGTCYDSTGFAMCVATGTTSSTWALMAAPTSPCAH